MNIYYLHGRNTLDDLMFDLLNSKSLVTTDITDGRKISLGLSKNEMEKLELAEIAKDGTVPAPIDRLHPKQSSLEQFFSEKKPDFVKRKKVSKKVKDEIEEIEEDDSVEELTPQDKPVCLNDRIKESSEKLSISS